MAEETKPTSHKIRSLDDLKKIKEKVIGETSLREDGYKAMVTVHMGTCGISSGARDILMAVMDELSKVNRPDIRVTTSGCVGICVHEPAMTVEVLGSEGVLYGDLNKDKVSEIVQKHLLAGKPVAEYAISQG